MLINNRKQKGGALLSAKCPTYEFHISRKARDYYRFDETLFSLRGDTLFANIQGAHLLANRINKERALLRRPETPLQASHLYASGLIDEILHYVIGLYKADKCPDLFVRLGQYLEEKFGKEDANRLLIGFAELFPSSATYRKHITPAEYLEGNSEGVPNTHLVLEELIMLWLGNLNPGYQPLHELIDDAGLEKRTIYRKVMGGVTEFFETMPTFGSDGQTLIEMLRAPAIHSPYSLEEQLKFIKERWGVLLGDLLTRLLKGIDFIKEEEKVRFDGPGTSEVPDFEGAGYDDEPERFSSDLDWMPKVVLMAKCTYVWLDQMSRSYDREISKLDQIPDEELDQLANWGITGLWLIGLWERSRASKTIKRWCGNPEAEASAYSLFDYDIAADLGGDAAFQNLKERAWRRGIRLTSDMVPNHMGIDSRWVIEHPHWFIQGEQPPFPSYTFTGGDLSDDSRVELFIEDGYWRRSDAAVVFKRVDRHTGDERYIYHGNDGTQMPWNDTAQLNFLLSEVREAVIQTILHVARKFPIIRFDAAMTLAKRHYQRLWFPEPGSGGDIPSRAEHAMTKEEFNMAFPVEFWREVVDRVQQEVPNTLLLAEAFWMMEGYFVRTLGMHRVYNSAFMNMLKMEENAKYREYIRKVLEFNPQILKRYVNFMNNPDEDTAIAQFGKDDKYFGVFILMCTMPGLPMIGHGQIEGFAEKYGMEYRRAYWDEHPDCHLVERHKREVFPLLKKRYLFSDVTHFLLYDFYTGAGHVDENVFAYSNGAGDERALVVYHNKYASTSGWVRESAAYNDGSGNLLRKSLGDGLGLCRDGNRYTIFRDHIAGLEYIKPNMDLIGSGLYVELGAFNYHVFLDFREVEESAERPYGELARSLNGGGVPSVEEAMNEFLLRPITKPFREAVNPGSLRYLAGGTKGGETDPAVVDIFLEKLTNLLKGVEYYEKLELEKEAVLEEAGQEFKVILRLPFEAAGKKKWGDNIKRLLPEAPSPGLEGWRVLISTTFIETLSKGVKKPAARLVDDWQLGKVMEDSFSALGVDDERIEAEVTLIKALSMFRANGGPFGMKKVASLLESAEARTFLEVNRHEDILWFSKERFEELMLWLFAISVAKVMGESGAKENIGRLYDTFQDAVAMAEESGYKLEVFLDLISLTKEAKSAKEANKKS